jgi:DNA polymerase-1
MPKVSKKKRLVLLDAHAIIHRAYHALPEFTGPDGAPTGALYGLAAMLLRIIQDLKPDYMVACYDLPKPTMRHEAYAEYKGKRAALEDALVAQLTTSRRVFEAFSIPIYEKEGFEADDIIGTIVYMTKKDKGLEVIIASGDMDTMQLVEGSRVRVYTLKKGLNDTIMYDEKAVEERYGFAPALVADYKGLRGDPSDNIVGIPGIGEKTGTELIRAFGTVENMYKVLKKDEEKFAEKGVKPRIVALLKEHEEDALFSKMLATIRTDAPIRFTLPEHEWSAGSVERIVALFDELGFRSLRARAKTVIAGDAEGDTEAAQEEAATPAEDVDPARLQEAKVMLWLLASDYTSAELDDILSYTKTQNFDDAYLALEAKIAETGRLREVYETIERPLIPVLRAMEECGVRIDRAVLENLRKNYRAELAALEKRIHEAAGEEFNINSPKQLGDLLFDKLGLKAKGQKKTAGGQRSTRESELEKIRDLHPIVDDILQYREIGKLLGTYIESIPPLLDKNDRIHPEFIQTGAATGRMATQNPSVQNIPIRTERGRAIRDAFIARDGSLLVGLDYSQIELRLAAILSKDEKLCAIFKSGRDVHREVAAMVFGVTPDKVDHEMRRRAKIINFGILYGMGANALKVQLGSSVAEAHQFLDDYFATFTTLAEYLESTKGFARKHGYTETLFGRRRQFPEMKSPLPYVRAQGERMAVNAPLQGTQADIIKLAMVRIDAMLREKGVREDAHLILQVHDELVFEVRKEKVKELAPLIENIMETVLTPEQTNGVPIIATAKAGPHWGDLAPL